MPKKERDVLAQYIAFSNTSKSIRKTSGVLSSCKGTIGSLYLSVSGTMPKPFLNHSGDFRTFLSFGNKCAHIINQEHISRYLCVTLYVTHATICRYGNMKAYEIGREQHATYETGRVHNTNETSLKLSQGRKEGSGHGQKGKPRPASGQDQKGKKKGSYKKKPMEA